MKLIDPRTTYILTNPANFAWRVLRSFQANQGLLRAGAVAYYALLSVLPLLILTAIALSHVMDRDVLLGAQLIAEYEYIKIGAP